MFSNYADGKIACYENDVVDLPVKIAKGLIQAGKAEEIKESKKREKPEESEENTPEEVEEAIAPEIKTKETAVSRGRNKP